MGWPKGKPRSEKTRKRMSEAKKGRKLPEETKRKLSKALEGNQNSLGYKHSEKTKRKMRQAKKGKNNPNWKGGEKKDGRGYILIWKPDHPHSTKQGYVKRARLIMEQHIGRYLEPGEVVHHKNEIRDDDSIENLDLFSNNGKHIIFHFLSRKLSL